MIGTGIGALSPSTSQATAADGIATWNLAFSEPDAEDSVTLTELSTDPAWHLAALECTVNGAPVQVTVAKSVTIAGVDVTAGHTVALRSDVNAYVITNTVNCTTLTLVKELEHAWGGTSEVSDWMLTATPKGGSAVVHPSGAALGVASGEHTVAEALRPERAALTTGYEFSHISCVADEQVLLDGAPDAVGLAVTVPAATDTVCVLTNTDKPGSLEWANVDEQQRPLAGSIWELTGPDGTVVEVTDLAGEQGQSPDVATDAGAFRLADLAWGTYQLREKQALAGYRLAEGSVEFTVGPEGDGLDVTFEKAFVNDPHDAVVLPLTGGTARDVFTLAAGGLLAGALLMGLVIRRRKVAPVHS